jgi:methionyl-tRNA formyltransferase
LLRALFADQRFEIIAVVTRPDEPTGRKQVLTPPPAKIAAQELGLRLLQPETLKDKNWTASYAELKPDIAVVVAYGKLIPQDILDIPKYKTLNVHPSLLPKYRGPSPIQAAIANGDEKTGVTIMQLDSEMDHGPILEQQTISLNGTETTPQLEARLANAAAAILSDSVAQYAAEDIIPAEQDHSAATFTHLITRDDGRVDWSKSAVEIERLYRAYDPWPGIWTEWKRGSKSIRLKLFEVSVEPNVSSEPGTVRESLTVACGTGGIKILRLQPEGKKEMSAEEFLSGHPEIVGSVFS